tara:strand:- start:3853 stop:4647 length:795 start_codon:yes stop_codon:yes gene_type:complete
MKKSILNYEKFVFNIIIPYLNKNSKKLQFIRKLNFKSKVRNQLDPVTSHDVRIQKELSKKINKNFPDHGIDGEEGSKIKKKKIINWVIDPIDGTKSFLIGMPTYSHLVGLEIDKKYKFGLAYFPVLKKYYITKKNKSYVFFNGKKRKTKTSNVKDLKKSKIVINTLRTIKNINFLNFFKKYKFFFKITGADSYNYCKLAEGDIDIILEANLKSFDIKPLIPIILNSGGVISDWSGRYYSGSGDILVSSNKILHNKILKILKKIK